MLPNEQAAQDLPFKVRGVPATDQEKADGFRIVKKMFTPGCKAAFYRPLTELRLELPVIEELFRKRLADEFLPGLRRIFPKFDSFPISAQRALVDMAYNLGIEGLSNFYILARYCNSGEWELATLECHVTGCRDERNKWRQDMFLDAAK
jgi:hypothetical protein